jgi:signal transduction histidine kinase
LRSSTQESNDLVLAIGSLGEEFAAGETSEHSMDFRIDVEGTSQPMHPIVRDEIYRIACEAVRNAFRHSHGTKVEAELHYDDWELRLRVRDTAGASICGRSPMTPGRATMACAACASEPS